MGELDFDELDRAVSSLMQKQSDKDDETRAINSEQATPPQSSDDIPPQETVASESPAVDQAGVVEEPNLQPQPEVTHTEHPTPSLATKRRGQFMDVVRPSSAAKLEQSQPKRPTRRSSTLQPLNPNISQNSSAAPSARSLDGVSAAPTRSPLDTTPPPVLDEVPEEVAAAEPSPASEWPDPLDMMQQREEAKRNAQVAAVESAPAEDSMVAQSEQETTGTDTTDAMNSPFLPDAKVEKRPLGGALTTDEDVGENDDLDKQEELTGEGSQEMVPEDSGTAEDKQIDEPASESLTNEQSTPSTLPEEFNSDLMSLEAHETTPEAPVTQQVQPEASAQEKTPDATTLTDAKTEQMPEPTPPPTPAPKMNSAAPVGSLPPRQTPTQTTNVSDDDVHNSIFDTDEAHPLKHPAKHSSGWFAVVIIGSMLIIGAIGGVIFYLMANGY